jgi:ribonuclease PH
MNIVMNAAGEFIEVQGTAEGVPFQRSQLNTLLDLAESGILKLIKLQKSILWP